MRLKELRERNNLLQKDVAAHLNCSVPVYCRYEKGDRMPSTDILKALADFYRVTVDYILGRDPEPQDTRDAEIVQLAAALVGLSDENLIKLLDYAKLLLLQQKEEQKK